MKHITPMLKNNITFWQIFEISLISNLLNTNIRYNSIFSSYKKLFD